MKIHSLSLLHKGVEIKPCNANDHERVLNFQVDQQFTTCSPVHGSGSCWHALLPLTWCPPPIQRGHQLQHPGASLECICPLRQDI